MTKTIHIEGMSCSHCSDRVERLLNAIEGVSAKVDLASKTATVEAAEGITDQLLTQTVTDAGYEVTAIS